jgi:hypothetical protein
MLIATAPATLTDELPPEELPLEFATEAVGSL